MTISAAGTHDHPLFKAFPISGRQQTSRGVLPTPYHIYAGHAVFIGGTANLPAVQALLQPEQVAPVGTVDGEALMGVWVVDATEASLGPHTELQFSLFVASEPVRDVSAHPFAILRLLLENRAVGMLCHGLWNDSEAVVAYNREVLGLNARLASGSVRRDDDAGTRAFAFRDTVAGRVIFRGAVREEASTAAGPALALTRLLGLWRMVQSARQSRMAARVVNPRGAVLAHNARAETYTHAERTVLQFYDRATDVLEFGESVYRALQFRPRFVEHFQGFKMVYLTPHS